MWLWWASRFHVLVQKKNMHMGKYPGIMILRNPTFSLLLLNVHSTLPHVPSPKWGLQPPPLMGGCLAALHSCTVPFLACWTTNLSSYFCPGTRSSFTAFMSKFHAVKFNSKFPLQENFHNSQAKVNLPVNFSTLLCTTLRAFQIYLGTYTHFSYPLVDCKSLEGRIHVFCILKGLSTIMFAQ